MNRVSEFKFVPALLHEIQLSQGMYSNSQILGTLGNIYLVLDFN